MDHSHSNRLYVYGPLPISALSWSSGNCDWIRDSAGHCASAGLLQGKVYEVSEHGSCLTVQHGFQLAPV